MKTVRLLSLVAVLAIVLLMFGLHTSAQAQCAGSYGAQGFAYPGWLGYYGSPYSLGQIPVPPYFALHPPVYYSHPVARSYGYSPYAYPGTVSTPEVVMPEMITNPYVAPGAEEEVDAGEAVEQEAVTTASYQIIKNPYVQTGRQERLATR